MGGRKLLQPVLFNVWRVLLCLWSLLEVTGCLGATLAANTTCIYVILFTMHNTLTHNNVLLFMKQ